MAKHTHEIRDPIHDFVRLGTDERRVLDSRPLQRLRHIHQLALSYLVYPGATHKRFEHSLGVMELASRVFDVVTRRENITDDIRRQLPTIDQEDSHRYWQRVLRMAALCHDVGHLPFSHAAESELLPPGWSHERLTRDIILSEEMRSIFDDTTPPLKPEHVAKLAIGPKEARKMGDDDLEFETWETILSEIIVGDAFGVDRMDYLLRDSHHLGVPYGRFGHFRLIDTLRILPSMPDEEPALGIEEGGIHSAEALMLARYFMFSQVYYHPVRRIYDIHLADFLGEWLDGGTFPVKADELTAIADDDVTVALAEAARDETKPGHDPARRILERGHFRVLYQRNPDDVRKNPDAATAVFEAAGKEFGEDTVRHDSVKPKSGTSEFPVLMQDGRRSSSRSVSEVLRRLPEEPADYVFVEPSKRKEAGQWLKENRDTIIQPEKEE